MCVYVCVYINLNIRKDINNVCDILFFVLNFSNLLFCLYLFKILWSPVLEWRRVTLLEPGRTTNTGQRLRTEVKRIKSVYSLVSIINMRQEGLSRRGIGDRQEYFKSGSTLQTPVMTKVFT